MLLLLAINMFNYMDRYILSAVEPRIETTFFGNANAALAQTGELATAFIISYMITSPIFGWLADRMSRWILVGIGVLLWSLASGASGMAMTFRMLLITRLFVGIGEAGYGPAAPTIISDLYPIERRGRMLAWFYMAIPVGTRWATRGADCSTNGSAGAGHFIRWCLRAFCSACFRSSAATFVPPTGLPSTKPACAITSRCSAIARICSIAPGCAR